MSITGDPEGSPAKMGMSVADVGGGMFGAIGVMMALETRHRTGRGQRVDTSLLEGHIAMMAQFFTRYFSNGEVPGPSGSGALTSPTYRAYQASDQWIVISAFNQRMWKGLCAALEQPDWLKDPRFIDPQMRASNRPILIQLIGAEIIKQPLAYWEKRLKENDVPCSPVNTIDKVVVQPQVIARDMVQEIELEGLGMMSMAGLPIKFSESPGSLRLPPPRLGQHTAEILSEMGYAAQQIKALAEQGAIGLDPGWVKVEATPSSPG
jgi:crotonobetainyl-CoA:carnitine CoA-transferase CaiB-like acyl-CoA transferase